MNARKTVTPLLLLLVAASLGYVLLGGERRGTAAAPQVQGSKIVAYYFHVNVRCTTCRAIEAYSKEVIHERFAEAIASGRVEWRLVNVQNPENRHFIQDYQLFTKSLVLVLYKGGQQKEYKVLNDTWELVRNKTAMQVYVEKELRNYLSRL